jgi:hypothetical protein
MLSSEEAEALRVRYRDEARVAVKVNSTWSLVYSTWCYIALDDLVLPNACVPLEDFVAHSKCCYGDTMVGWCLH